MRTHNLGTVESMGNIIFLAGERRSACQHSKFLFHPFHWNLNGSVDHARMSEYAMSLDYDLHLYARIVAERTPMAAEPLDILDYLKAAPHPRCRSRAGHRDDPRDRLPGHGGGRGELVDPFLNRVVPGPVGSHPTHGRLHRTCRAASAARQPAQPRKELEPLRRTRVSH